MKNLVFILCGVVIFLSLCIYLRTGYFESSINNQEMTIYFKNGDSITSNKYYRDLSGNWILLDKNYVVTNDKLGRIEIKVNK